MAIAAEQQPQYVTIADPDTRFIARDIRAMGGVWNAAKQEWVFPGSEIARTIVGPGGVEQSVKVFSSPEADKADALLELYHATRPTPESLKQLEEVIKRVPLKALGIFDKANSPEAKAKVENLLNPHIVTRSRVEALLTKTAGFFIDHTPEQKAAIDQLVAKGYDKIAWGFDYKEEPHKLFGPDHKKSEAGKLTLARANQLINLAKPYVMADQRRAQMEADRAVLAGDLEGRSGAMDYTKANIGDDPTLLNQQQRLAAEGGVDDRRRAAFDAERAHKQRSELDLQHGKRPDALKPEALGFSPDRAGLRQEALEKDDLAVSKANLQRKLGELLEAETSYSAMDVVMREPRVGTTLSGTVVAFEKVEDGGFLAAIQHETSPKTFTVLNTQQVKGRLADGAFVKLAMGGSAQYQVVVDTSDSTVRIVNANRPETLDAMADGKYQQASGIMSLAQAQAFCKDRGYPVTDAPTSDSSAFREANVLFSGIGNNLRAEINRVPEDVAMKAWGMVPAKTADFFKSTSAEQGHIMLEQAVGHNPTLEAAAQMHAIMTQRAIAAGAQAAYEIPVDMTSATTFTAQVIYNDGTIIGLDRGHNRWSQVPLSDISTRLANIREGERLKVEVKNDSDKLHISKAPKTDDASTGGHKRKIRRG